MTMFIVDLLSVIAFIGDLSVIAFICDLSAIDLLRHMSPPCSPYQTDQLSDSIIAICPTASTAPTVASPTHPSADIPPPPTVVVIVVVVVVNQWYQFTAPMVISPFASSDDASRDRRQNVAAVDDGGEIGERHEVRGGVGADPRTGAPGADGGPKDQIPPRRQRPITSSDENDGQRVDDLDGDEDGVVDG